jgi:Fe-S-cluster containining protein
VADHDDDSLRRDLDSGLRFTHDLMGDARRELFETEMSVFALIDELINEGVLDEGRFNVRRQEAREQQTPSVLKTRHVRIHDCQDKYTLTDLPDIDCEARMPLCKGRCCTFVFPLSNQDLDERVVKWNYGRPYLIRQNPGEDGHRYCVHSHPDTHGCTVYQNRPAVCRTYSCKTDKRIWKDFDARIPADDWPPKADDLNG